jgi:phosphoribosylglycinamide formyltransferase 1
MVNIVVFASGEGSNAEQIISYFSSGTIARVTWVVSNNEDAGVVHRARKFKKGIQFISSSTLQQMPDAFIEFLKCEKTDLIVLAGFLLKIPPAFVTAFPNQILNLHPALLPAYGGKGMYGMHVHRAVIANKEKKSGITVHYVNEEYDKGEIVLQQTCEISENETPETLAVKIQQLEHEYFPKAIEFVIQKLKFK